MLAGVTQLIGAAGTAQHSTTTSAAQVKKPPSVSMGGGELGSSVLCPDMSDCYYIVYICRCHSTDRRIAARCGS
jgi:hypothetical protein